MKAIRIYRLLFVALIVVSQTCQSQTAALEVRDPVSGLRLLVDDGSSGRALKLLLPGSPGSDPAILIIFPEHVTARLAGSSEAHQLYLARPGNSPGKWQRSGNTLEYTLDLPGEVKMLARASLESDGVRYRYTFVNRSKDRYDMIYAVTDPRMTGPYFRDVRLERTYVHLKSGFDLLASESPERLTEPLSSWLPNRYRVSYTWPIDQQRIAKQPDGITWHNRSVAVDEPFVATRSTDGKWVIATFAYDPGNVWSNPELTCQHTDPQVSLDPGQTAGYELKTLVIRGGLEDVLRKVREQRPSLKR